MKTVVDLNAGIGGRVTAFLQQGMEIKAVYENDSEKMKFLTNIVGKEKVNLGYIGDTDFYTIPDADIYAFNYIMQSFSKAGNRNIENVINPNSVFHEIIHIKRPKCIFIEATSSAVLRKTQMFENYLIKFQEMGYSFSYQFYDENSFSSFPLNGKRAYIVGIRDCQGEMFKFPVPNKIVEPEILLEGDEEIEDWYRTSLKFDVSQMEYSKWYIKVMNKIKETDKVSLGAFTEQFLVDSIGPRRFTHNELARFKGLTSENYNDCSNKRRMYYIIASSSNVFTVNAIASCLRMYFEDIMKKESDAQTVEIVSNKGKKQAEAGKVIFPKIQLKKIYIEKLKNLEKMEIIFDKRLTAIMGVNGAGKSTILHALACTYSKYSKGEDYKFSYFFTPNPDALWNNSSLTVTNFDENVGRILTKNYKKNERRWADYSSRPTRDIYYFGIDSCIPEIEKEKKTSFINYVSNNDTRKHAKEVLANAAYVLQKNYTQLLSNSSSSKTYIGVHTENGLKYSSLSMGAGEQRVIKLLQTAYDAHQYSLILIDEIDLLLHVDALKKLIEVLAGIAEKKKIQFVFTTHSLAMQDLLEFVDIKYIEHDGEKILIYDTIKPDLLFELSGERKKDYQIYVEDKLAEAIVKKLLKELQMQKYVSVIRYGSITNSFIIAAQKVIVGENTDNILIVTDGDDFVTNEEKYEQMKKKWSGTEKGKEEDWNKAISLITQFNLPKNTPPEKYVHSLLTELSIDSEIVGIAKRMTAVNGDSHKWIGDIVEQIGDEKETLTEIMDLISHHQDWDKYTENVKTWLQAKKELVTL